MVTEGEGAVDSVDMPSAKRKELASKSRGYSCSTCGLSHEALAKRWDKPTDKKRSQDNEKDEMTESPALKDETHTEESSTTSLATEPETLEQPLLASAPAAPAATTEKLSPIEILRRRRVSRMKQKEAQTKSVVKGDDDDDDEKDREDEKDEITEPENQEQHHPAATTTPIEEHNAERTEEQNNAQPDEGELVLAPEETIRNLILDKTVILILFAIVLLALRKWVLFQ